MSFLVIPVSILVGTVVVRSAAVWAVDALEDALDTAFDR
jgi:nitrogen fixation-related uncharacterized protein